MPHRSPNAPDDSDSTTDETEPETDPAVQAEGDVFHTRYGEDESPSEAVVSAVSAVRGVRPTEMECLHDSIDPDALDAIFDGPVVIGNSELISVAFRYSGYRVRVQNNGSITILEDTR